MGATILTQADIPFGRPHRDAPSRSVGATIGAVVGHFVLVERLEWRSKTGTRDYLVEAAHAAHALIALYALTNLDVLLARAADCL